MTVRRNTDLPPELREHMVAIRAKAREYGLDFFDVVFEVVDFRTMNQIAAYGGFPTRYPHWRWGMEFEKLSKRDAYGMGRIYELVINNNPCYAYLQESNALADQKLVMSHVFAHADFFKSSAWFARTDRSMINTMANHATRVERHIEKHGKDTVERFIDACLSVEHLIDPYTAYAPAHTAAQDSADQSPPASADSLHATRLPSKGYMDPFINPRHRLEAERAEAQKRDDDRKGKDPARPTRDVLLYLLRHAPLDDWQRDILTIIRDESYYFAPQAMTKVLNEGWATYWHTKLMTGHFADASEIVQYADQHSGVVHMPAGGFNPYKIGVELLRDVEDRYDRGRHGPDWERLPGLGQQQRYDDRSMRGREKLFEIRRFANDITFLDEYLTEEFVERTRMYRYVRDPATGEVKVATRDWKKVKAELLARLSNMGQPFIYVVDGNYRNRGELYLAHQWNGLEVDLAKAGEVLKNLRILWGRPVHAQCRIGDEMNLLSFEALPGADAEPTRQKIRDDTPKPAHMVE
jgi:stage V sporulation protein R